MDFKFGIIQHLEVVKADIYYSKQTQFIEDLI